MFIQSALKEEKKNRFYDGCYVWFIGSSNRCHVFFNLVKIVSFVETMEIIIKSRKKGKPFSHSHAHKKTTANIVAYLVKEIFGPKSILTCTPYRKISNSSFRTTFELGASSVYIFFCFIGLKLSFFLNFYHTHFNSFCVFAFGIFTADMHTKTAFDSHLLSSTFVHMHSFSMRSHIKITHNKLLSQEK